MLCAGRLLVRALPVPLLSDTETEALDFFLGRPFDALFFFDGPSATPPFAPSVLAVCVLELALDA